MILGSQMTLSGLCPEMEEAPVLVGGSLISWVTSVGSTQFAPFRLPENQRSQIFPCFGETRRL